MNRSIFFSTSRHTIKLRKFSNNHTRIRLPCSKESTPSHHYNSYSFRACSSLIHRFTCGFGGYNLDSIPPQNQQFVFISTKSTPDKSTSFSAALLVDKLPIRWQPYARLARMDKPIGTMLLLWPCFWSTALAAPSGCLPDPTLLALFSTGAFVMRGAGCTINDMWDADYDAQVSRTTTRPLASGELAKTQALGFLALQLSTGLAVLLSLPHAEFCFGVGAASLPLVVCYPLMKRFTNWPQLVLGLTFNWGAFMGWAAVYGDICPEVVVPLYFSGVCWTLVYDTLYAHQDKNDDAKLGLKSTALHFGTNTKSILYGFSALAFSGWLLTGYNIGYTSPLYYLGCTMACSHLIWQTYTADLENSENLSERFRSNQYVGAVMFLSCVAGNIF